MNKGEFLESRYSIYYHFRNTPFLISPLLLRSLDLGQIDLAYLKKEKNHQQIFLIEVKNSLYPSHQQMKRLQKTQEYLSQVLNIETKLAVKFCKKRDSSLSF